MSLIIEGFEEQKVTVTSLPVIAIAQPLTPEVAEGLIKPGRLMNSISKQDLGDKVRLVGYSIWKGRTKIPPKSEGNKIDCFSPDGKVGITYGNCDQCEFADFNRKDACKMQTTFIVSPIDDPAALYRVIFWKSSSSAGNKLIKLLRAECAKRRAKSIYEVNFVLTTKKLKNEANGGTYFVFTPEIDEEAATPAEILPELQENFNIVKELRQESIDHFYSTLQAGGATGSDPILTGGIDEEGPADNVETTGEEAKLF